MAHSTTTRLLLSACVLAVLGSSAESQPAPLTGTYLLKLDVSAKKRGDTNDMAVTIGGQTFKLNVNGSQTFDITRLLRAGPNSVRIRWGQRCTILCTAQIAYGTQKNQYRTLFDFKPFSYNPGQGDYTYTIVADGPRTAGRVSMGSAAQQTLLKGNVPHGFVQVWLNDQFLGDLTGLVERDISGYVKPGTNQIKLVWDKKYGTPPAFGDLSVAYAATKNNFKTLWETSVVGQYDPRPTFTFEVP